MADNTNQPQPGLIGGHAQYVKGVAEAAIGDASGSHAWKSSGEQDKAAAIDTMKAAGEQRNAQGAGQQGFGKVEELAGKATGCEGMQKEGAASTKQE